MIKPRPRRSVLYMPGANARALEKAKTIAADALILDLEDAVAPDAKSEARDRVAAAVAVHRSCHRRGIAPRQTDACRRSGNRGHGVDEGDLHETVRLSRQEPSDGVGLPGPRSQPRDVGSHADPLVGCIHPHSVSPDGTPAHARRDITPLKMARATG